MEAQAALQLCCTSGDLKVKYENRLAEVRQSGEIRMP